MIPTVTSANGAPRMAVGAAPSSSLSRNAAKHTITSEKPNAAPSATAIVPGKPRSSPVTSSATPSTAQFVVMSGR